MKTENTFQATALETLLLDTGTVLMLAGLAINAFAFTTILSKFL